MDFLLPIILFAISSSITPGPNNIMVMTSGVNFGIRKSLPLFFGICVGFTIMLLLVGVGFGQLFKSFPVLHLMVKSLGILYLLYLSFLVATAGEVALSGSQAKPFTFMKGALFQWLNGKAWVVATGAVAAFTTVGVDFYLQNYIIALVFLVVSFPSVGVWLFFGSVVKTKLKSETHRRFFNYAMATLLVISVVPVIADLTAEFV